MAATQIAKPFHRPGWVYEEKYDGWRMLAYKDGTASDQARREGLVFKRRDGAAWGQIRTAFASALNRAGIKRFRDLRHTFLRQPLHDAGRPALRPHGDPRAQRREDDRPVRPLEPGPPPRRHCRPSTGSRVGTQMGTKC